MATTEVIKYPVGAKWVSKSKSGTLVEIWLSSRIEIGKEMWRWRVVRPKVSGASFGYEDSRREAIEQSIEKSVGAPLELKRINITDAEEECDA